jgi:hypothetical protein
MRADGTSIDFLETQMTLLHRYQKMHLEIVKRSKSATRLIQHPSPKNVPEASSDSFAEGFCLVTCKKFSIFHQLFILRPYHPCIVLHTSNLPQTYRRRSLIEGIIGTSIEEKA